MEQYREKLRQSGELVLRVKVRPGASNSVFKELMTDGTVKLDIAAAPEGGRANRELARFLADFFEVKRENVLILSGAADRYKLVKINN